MIPAYIQIHDQIKSEIDQKIWKIGERLPSERDLAEKFQVSRMTLRQAITLLVEEGVLERRVGSGTFITSTRIPVVYEVASIPEKFIKNFNREEVTSHFFQTLERHGYKIGKSHQTIYARLAKDKIADYLQISKGQAILGLTQVSYFEDGTAFEYVKSQYVGERFEFYLENN